MKRRLPLAALLLLALTAAPQGAQETRLPNVTALDANAASSTVGLAALFEQAGAREKGAAELEAALAAFAEKYQVAVRPAFLEDKRIRFASFSPQNESTARQLASMQKSAYSSIRQLVRDKHPENTHRPACQPCDTSALQCDFDQEGVFSVCLASLSTDTRLCGAVQNETSRACLTSFRQCWEGCARAYEVPRD